MTQAKPNRRQMLEICISRGFLAAGAITVGSKTSLENQLQNKL